MKRSHTGAAFIFFIVAAAYAGAQSAGTPLKMADPSTFPAARLERAGIEEALLRADPDSLNLADRLIAKSLMLKADELLSMRRYSALFRALLYPEEKAEDGATLTRFQSVQGTQVSASPVLLSAAASALGVFAPPSADPATAGATAKFALNVADRVQSSVSGSILPGLLRGRIAENSADFVRAIRAYESALSIVSNLWPASLAVARSQMALGRFREAILILDPLSVAHPGASGLTSLHAAALYENNRMEEAGKAAALGLESNPLDLRLLLIHAHVLMEAGDFGQTLAALETAARVDPADRLFLRLRTSLAERLKDNEGALGWARRGLALYPNDPILLVQISRILFAGPEAGFVEARECARRALALLGVPDIYGDGSTAAAENTDPGADSASPRERNERDRAMQEAARLLMLDAATDSQRAMTLAYLNQVDGYVVSRETRAMILRNSGRVSEALAYAEAWHREEPDSESAIEALLRALLLGGAVDRFRDEVGRVDVSGASHRLKSYIYYAKGVLADSGAQAIILFRSALIESADNVEALVAAAELQLRAGDLESSRYFYDQAQAFGTTEADLAARMKALGDKLRN